MATDSSAQPPPRGLDAKGLDNLAQLSSEPPEQRIDHALEIARTIMGMDLAYVTQYSDGEQVYRTVAGDGATFGITEDAGYPWEGTICQRMLDGRIPKVVNNLAENSELRSLAVTKLANIGAYIGVPIVLSDNTMFGTLCTISHAEHPELDERDLRLMEVLAHIVASGIEQQRLERENEQLRQRIEQMGSQLEEAEEDIRLTMILDTGEFTRLESAPATQSE